MPSEEQVEAILRYICVEWGFCMTGDDCHEILEIPNLGAAEFAARVIKAEGIQDDEYWRPRLEEIFVKESVLQP